MDGRQEDAPVGEDLIATHAPMVYNLALRLTGNPMDAEDLAQDAMLRAWKGLGQFKGESQASTWLYRITVNTWKNRVRSEKRRSFWKTVSLELFTGEDKDEEPPFKADDPPPDASLQTEEKGQAVQNALMRLDPESREVVVLRDLNDRSYQEIADILGVPEGTVKSRLSRARSALKEALKNYMSEV